MLDVSIADRKLGTTLSSYAFQGVIWSANGQHDILLGRS
jgi:hypothetical protein